MLSDAQIAADSSSPSPALRQLYDTWFGNVKTPYRSLPIESRKECDEVGTALACHPNTPPDILRLLLTRYPEAVAHNPLLPLLPLENPAFWHDANEAALLKILRLCEVPVPVLQIFARGGNGKTVQRAAQYHVGLAGELDTAYWQDAARKLCRTEPLLSGPIHPFSFDDDKTAALIDNWKNQLLADWVEVGLVPASWLPPVAEPLLHRKYTIDPNYAGALHPNTSAETLVRLASGSDDNTMLGVALHPNTPPDVLRVLLEKKSQHFFNHGLFHSGIPLAAACHPNADAALLRELAQHEEPVVRRLARRHPNAPPDLTAISLRAVTSRPSERATNYMFWIGDATALWTVFCALHTLPRTRWIAARTKSTNPVKRLAAVLCLRNRAVKRAGLPYPGQQKIACHEQRLWEVLKSDANRVVRAAANAPITAHFDFSL